MLKTEPEEGADQEQYRRREAQWSLMTRVSPAEVLNDSLMALLDMKSMYVTALEAEQVPAESLVDFFNFTGIDKLFGFGAPDEGEAELPTVRYGGGSTTLEDPNWFVQLPFDDIFDQYLARPRNDLNLYEFVQNERRRWLSWGLKHPDLGELCRTMYARALAGQSEKKIKVPSAPGYAGVVQDLQSVIEWGRLQDLSKATMSRVARTLGVRLYLNVDAGVEVFGPDDGVPVFLNRYRLDKGKLGWVAVKPTAYGKLESLLKRKPVKIELFQHCITKTMKCGEVWSFYSSIEQFLGVPVWRQGLGKFCDKVTEAIKDDRERILEALGGACPFAIRSLLESEMSAFEWVQTNSFFENQQELIPVSEDTNPPDSGFTIVKLQALADVLMANVRVLLKRGDFHSWRLKS